MKPLAQALWTGCVMALALCALLFLSVRLQAQADPLPSWDDGPAKQVIFDQPL